METIGATAPALISSKTDRVCIKISRGGAARVLANTSGSTITIRREGSCDWATYPIHESLCDGTVCFLTDEIFLQLPTGRYDGLVSIEDECCARFEIELTSQNCQAIALESMDGGNAC
jgi:hypothetical protein